MRILAIAGSVSRGSSNSRLLQGMAAAAASVDRADRVDGLHGHDRLEVHVWEALDQLPYFRPDADGNAAVAQLRTAIAAADAVWIATPEYAGGMPGALKNALDWLVGSGELYGKRVVVLSAAPSEQRGGNARRWVEEVARMQGADVLESFSVALGPAASDARFSEVAAQALARVERALSG